VLDRSGRKLTKQAPRLDLLGRRALARGYRLLGSRPPRKRLLNPRADLINLASTALWYGLWTRGRRNALAPSLAGGLIAGLRALIAEPYLGIRRRDSALHRALTVGWYVAGAASAAGAARLIGARSPATA
jgi:hypothetical protein